jgi:ankyrin repeat protein
MALYEAVELGEVGNVERLLAAGADPQAIPDTRFLLPLEVAAKVGIAQVAKSLIKYGAQPDSATSKETPLWIALHYSNGLTAAEIVKGGANFMAPEFEGCTPFHYALLNDERAVVAAMRRAALAVLCKWQPANNPWMCSWTSSKQVQTPICLIHLVRRPFLVLLSMPISMCSAC